MGNCSSVNRWQGLYKTVVYGYQNVLLTSLFLFVLETKIDLKIDFDYF